ncbi:ATP-binding protein [Nitrosospira sp. NpAV]|uniref:sensor histidine kinase n=1 Tax=Nitrosospira sp. NpAV TaxID=58133 RepID=UPI000697F073|nr:sensor histidine kinase [Nitrosospira sp. NpAV]
MTFLQLLSKHSVVIAFWIALVTLSVITTLSYTAHNRAYDNWRWVEHTQQVSLEIEELVSLYLSARVSWRNFLSAGNAVDLHAYESAVKAIPLKIESLWVLTTDHPQQQNKIKTLSTLLHDDIAVIAPTMSLKASGQHVDPAAPFAPNLNWQEIKRVADIVQNEEKELLTRRSSELGESTARLVLIIVTGNIASLGILTAIFYFLKREVHQRRIAQKALAQSERHFRLLAESEKAANTELESFSYSVSHDLRAPLRAIDGYSRILQEDYAASLDDEGKRLLGVIRKNSKRMGSLIDDLLEFSRLGRKQITATKVDMAALVKEVIEDIQLDFKERAVQTCVHELPPAHGDRALIRQVWINLLTNAFKFTSHVSPAYVELGSREGNGMNIYYVKDNGAGFDMRYYDKLFGIFHRLHRDDEFPGTGVGLAIVERVILRHNGRVWAEAKENEGATFFFELPQGSKDE